MSLYQDLGHCYGRKSKNILGKKRYYTHRVDIYMLLRLAHPW